MKHVVIFILIAISIYFLAIRKSDLDKLLVPITTYTEAQTGNRYVDIDPAKLPITPHELAELGVITIVYFHDNECHGCQQMDRDLTDFLRIRPDVAIRKIAMSPGNDGYTEAIRDYQWRVYTAPCILIFGPNRKLIAGDDGVDGRGFDLLEDWMRAELTKAANQK